MPGLVVSDIFRRVQTTLQDAGATRWPMAELLDALNGCLLAISHAKPSVFAEAIELQLAEGPAQELGAGASQLLRVIRNITSAPGAAPRVGGAAITMANRESLDRRLPGWTDPSVVPYTTAVQHVMTDTEHPELFHVFPGNDGTGVIEVVAAMVPDLITAPADPDDIDSYTDELPIGASYTEAVVSYILYRCFSKDMQLAGSAARATAHLQQFNQMLGIRTAVEARSNPETAG